MDIRKWGEAGALGEIRRFELGNASGMRVVLSDLGAGLVSWLAPDRRGHCEDVLLGHDTPQQYLDSSAYLGFSIGRWANRIAAHRYTHQGRTWLLDANEGEVTLHGGHQAFHRRKWAAEADGGGVRFALHSPDGECGFPGAVDVQVRYALAEDGTLSIDFTAQADRPTPLNLTNHAYFNLAGAGRAERPTVLDHHIRIAADRYVPVDEHMIPTGIAPVDGTPFDFRTSGVIGEHLDFGNSQVRLAGGIDHCFLLAGGAAGTLRPAVTLTDPHSGRTLWVASDGDGVQFYTGNRLDGVARRSGGRYRAHEGLCLEPGAMPDALNFEGPEKHLAVPGQDYRRAIRYRMGAL